MAEQFSVQSTQNTLYLDRGGQPVNGYRIRVLLEDFDEIHDLNVPNLKPETVMRAVEDLLIQRRALRDLGGA